MIPYITFKEKDKKGVEQFYILQKDFPHYIGMIKNEYEPGNWYAGIMDYNLWVIFSGTLRGNIVPSYKDVSKEIQTVLDDMAIWYLVNIISPKESNYKKLKINVSSPI